MPRVSFSMIFRQCIYAASPSLIPLPVFPNVLQFCWVSISSFVLKMLPFIHQIFHLLAYLMHSHYGWKKKKKQHTKEISKLFFLWSQIIPFWWVGCNTALKCSVCTWEEYEGKKKQHQMRNNYLPLKQRTANRQTKISQLCPRMAVLPQIRNKTLYGFSYL